MALARRLRVALRRYEASGLVLQTRYVGAGSLLAGALCFHVCRAITTMRRQAETTRRARFSAFSEDARAEISPAGTGWRSAC